MKRKMIILFCGVILLLSACSSNSTSGNPTEPATHSTEGKVYNVELGEEFLYHRMGAVNKSTTKLEITLSDYEIVKEKSADDSLREDVDYLKLYALVENVGDENSHDMAIHEYSFNIYDANGKEISVSTLTTQRITPEDEFKPAELRPGGKNEGFLYITIEEGSVPAEIIFYDAMSKTAAHANQYVVKL